MDIVYELNFQLSNFPEMDHIAFSLKINEIFYLQVF
jgi:hypothetical protein